MPLPASILSGQGSKLDASASSSATSRSGDIRSESSFTSGDFYIGSARDPIGSSVGNNNIIWIVAGAVALAFLFLRKK